MMRPTEVISYRLQNALLFPIQHRCDELARIINEANHKDLHDAFPTILESVFGLPGWGLRSTDKNTNVLEVDCMLRFLDPMGPLFMLAYRLGSDFFLKYELSLNCLPPKLRRELESGSNVPPLYCERLFIDPQTRRPSALLLSPFELLVFRYALHILPRLQPEVWVDSVYTQLSERLLCHFLPCDPQAGPVQPHVPHTAQVQQRSPPHLSPFVQHSTPVKQGQNLSLLKASIAMNLSPSSPSSPACQQSPLVEIWRTVLLAQVLVDVWLSVDDDLPASLSPAHLRSSFSAQNHTMLSSAEHARMVRCLLKHLHYFANSACYTNSTAMDEMKRLILPSSKLKIYRYLTHTMANWPLDTSFRVILEAWLSYIQPWRYTNFTNYNRQENEESGRAVDRRWQTFIAEHLPAYSVVFRQLLARFHRLDLATLKNAIMLHRLTKVFSLTNLREMIEEVEESLVVPSTASLLRPGAASGNSPEGRLKWQSAAKLALVELEGSDANYQPLFGPQTATKVRVFVEELLASRNKAHRLAEEQQLRQGTGGFWSWLVGPGDLGLEEYTLEDRHRVTQILQHSADQLCRVFQVPDMQSLSSSVLSQTSRSDSSSQFNMSSLGESALWSSSQSLQSEGDPDRRHICSFEVGWLVRIFHDISSYVNREYGVELQTLHARRDLVGRLARQVLQPPRSIFVYERGPEGYKVRCEKVLPARLSLRRLARRGLLACLLLVCVAAWWAGRHPLLGLTIPACLYLLVIAFNALRE